VYTVRAHDTPASIARKFTGSPRRFRELVAANPQKVRAPVRGPRGLGQTFASLREGERLHVPRTWPQQVVRTGVGQNYLWDRYPGEIEPSEPAHTGVIGLAGCCGKCGKRGPCPPHDPNYGATEPHLRAGQGPLSDGERMYDPCAYGVGQVPAAGGVPVQAPGSSTINTPIALVQTPSGAAPVSTALPAAPAPVSAPAMTAPAPATTPAQPSPAMLLAGFAAVGLGLAGIVYLVNARRQATS
jgi:hypothetical protein